MSRYEIYINRLDRGDLMAVEDAAEDSRLTVGEVESIKRFAVKVLKRYCMTRDFVRLV